MSSAIPQIPALNLQNLPSTKTGLVNANDPNDANRAILQVQQNFSQILQVLQTNPDSSQDSDSNSSSFSNSFNFAAGITNSPVGNANGSNGQDIFSILNNSFGTLANTGLNNVQTTQQTLAALQKLSALDKNSALLGNWVQYLVSGNNEFATGRVRKILLDSNGIPQIELEDGKVISPNQVIGLAEDQSNASA